ncbi:MAG TPA: glycosyltransferase [Rhodothermales bacterium]|nr:glycosyl transferase [Bacteroidota bacterium]HRK73477.1 glycosyltransferase [Rhodothermales bacterium]HRR08925.1 glycosyltransferase [Rhodothermales bacterium]
MTFLLAAFSFFTVFYALLLIAFAWGFRDVVRSYQPRHIPDPEKPFVTVVIAARNEADNILLCLHRLLENHYPQNRFEVIVVNDDSSDQTAAIVDELRKEYANLRLLHMPENSIRTRAHKKKAIEKGVLQAKGEIILTTDADCLVPKHWIETMTANFEANTAFVSGPVAFRHKYIFFKDIQALEFLGLVAVGAGAIGLNRPNLANGANVAYRKSVFLEIKGFDGIDHLTSGDDEMLMQKIAATETWKVRFCPSPDALVRTDPVATFQDLIQQRKRWASKGALYPNKAYVATIISIYWFFLLFVLTSVALFWYPNAIWFLAGALGLKILSEGALLFQAARQWRQRRLLAYFLPGQLLHIPYIVYIGLVSQVGGYQWKGRQIQR